MRYRVFFRTHPENSWKKVKEVFDCKQYAEGYAEASTIASRLFFPTFQTEVEPAECSHGKLIDEEDCRGCGQDAEADAKLDAWRGK